MEMWRHQRFSTSPHMCLPALASAWQPLAGRWTWRLRWPTWARRRWPARCLVPECVSAGRAALWCRSTPGVDKTNESWYQIKQWRQQHQDDVNYYPFLLFVCKQLFCSHLSVGGSLRYGANGRNGRVGHSGGQRHSGEGGHARLALLPLVGHEGRQGVELFLTLPAQEDVLIVCVGWSTSNNDWHATVISDLALIRQGNHADFHPLPGAAPY